MSNHSPRVLRQRAQAIALLITAALAVALVTITALGAKPTTARHTSQRVSAVAQTLSDVVLFARALVFGWPGE